MWRARGCAATSDSAPCVPGCCGSSASTKSPPVLTNPASPHSRRCSRSFDHPIPHVIPVRSKIVTLTTDRPTANAGQTFDIVPLSGSIGAELRGLDLRHLSDADVAAIRQEWLRYKVVFFPGANLNPEEH